MITLRYATPEEERPVHCGAKRSPRGAVVCEKPAFHRQGCKLVPGHACAGRGRRGQWYFWFSPWPWDRCR